MNTVLFNDVAKKNYLIMVKQYRCVKYPIPQDVIEIMRPLPHSKLSLSHDIYNAYTSMVIDLAKSQVDNGILNIAHQWAVENIRPRKALTVTENKMFYSDLERWRVSDRIYLSEFTKRSMVYDFTKYRDR